MRRVLSERASRPWLHPGFGLAAAKVAIVFSLLEATEALGVSEENEAPASARSILSQAFANRYDVNLTSTIELVMRNRSGQERRRRFEAVSKVIDGRVHSLGRLVWPNHLRGMTILTIENFERGHDAFVFLPSLDKVRRISTAQRADSFMGSDVTYEDLERRRVDEYRLEPLAMGEVQGEPVYQVSGRSLRTTNYARVSFLIAESDGAILETRYFKRSQDEPFRLLIASRKEMILKDGHVLPTKLTVRNLARGTETDVRFDDLEINPPIDDRLFSVSTLERERTRLRGEN